MGKDSHPLSQNRYAFVLNNPFKYSDPSGHIALPYLMEDRGTSIPKASTTTNTNIISDVGTSVPKTVINKKLQQLYNDEVKLVQTSQLGSKSSIGSANVPKNKVDAKLEQLYNEEVKQVNLSQSSSSNSTIKNTNTISTEPLHDDIGDIYKNYKKPLSISVGGTSVSSGKEANNFSYVNDKYGIDERIYAKKNLDYDAASTVLTFAALAFGAFAVVSASPYIAALYGISQSASILSGFASLGINYFTTSYLYPKMENEVLERNIKPISDYTYYLSISSLFQNIVNSLSNNPAKQNQASSSENTIDEQNGEQNQSSNSSVSNSSSTDNVQINKGESEELFDWKQIKSTQSVIEGTNVPISFVIEGLELNGNKIWVGGNATKHIGEFITSANKAGGGLLSESEIMKSFMDAVKLALEQNLNAGDNRLFIGGWEIGINGTTSAIYHALMK